MFKPHELKLAKKLLEIAAEYFGNRSCNDFDLCDEVGLTREEAYEINQAYVQWNGNPEEYEEKELRVTHAVAGDDGMMAWLAARMEHELEEKSKHLPG